MRNLEKLVFCFCLIALLAGCARLGESVTASPGGKVRVKVFATRTTDTTRLVYTVDFKGKTVIEPSALGVLVDGDDLGYGVGVGKTETASVNERYPWRGVKSEAINHCNESKISVTPREGSKRKWSNYQFEVRAFDDGVAFRYVVPGTGTRTVTGEMTRFRLPEGSQVWWAATRPMFDYENRFQCTPVSELRPNTRIAPVTTVELPGGGYAALTEGCLVNYCGMHYLTRGNRVLQSCFENASWDLTGEIVSPWRIVMLADDLNGLVNCDIVHNVCPPPSPELAKAGWIKPGLSLWAYLGGTIPPGAPGGNQGFENEMKYTEVAGKLAIPYNLVDAGWESWTPDKWAKLKEITEFGKKNNVKILVWKHKNGVSDPEVRQEFFKNLSECGVVGVKIDFFNSEGIDAVNLQNDIMKDATQYKLLIIFHGCNKPTGNERTWPNEVGREGIPGLEKQPPWSKQNCILPFTRLLAGHADFTPLTFDNRPRPNRQPRIGETSYAHQIATVMSYTTSLQNISINPQDLLKSPALDLIKSIPADWDETVVLKPSKIGSLLALARRSGKDWYVCVLNGDEQSPRTVKIELPFLGAGKYNALIAKDKLDEQLAVVMDRATVGASDSFEIQMRAGGGWSARLSPIQ